MYSNNPSGLISDIQHCSVHDGFGIRTTVFLKGCNLRCKWCHNPETISCQPEVLIDESRCIGCGQCANGCFSGTRVMCGRTMSVADVMADILLDVPYYGSNGGITISGGEPMLQFEFTRALLTECRNHCIHTAVETNLSLNSVWVNEICSLCDLIMCDVKLFDSERHRAYTGIGNEGILGNLAMISQLSKPIIVRTPIVAGVNDSASEIKHIMEYLANLDNIYCYELLSYHPLGLAKGKSEHFTPTEFTSPTGEHMRMLCSLADGMNLNILIDNVPFKLQ